MSSNNTFVSTIDRLAGQTSEVNTTVVTDITKRELRNRATFSKRIDVLNLTNENILIRDKRGMEYHLEPSNYKMNLPSFFGVYIFEEVSFDNTVKYNNSQLSVSGKSYEMLEDVYNKIMRDEFDKILEERTNTHMRTSRMERVVVRHDIPLQLLEEGGGVFLDTCDYVVSLERSKFRFHHPESKVGIELQKADQENTNSFNYGIEIVDRYNRIGNRWVNILGSVRRIKNIMSSNEMRKDGIYIEITTPDGIERLQYELTDGISKVGLYVTEEEARVHGDLKSVSEFKREKELASLNHLSKVELARLGLTKMQRDDYFDERKYERSSVETERKHDYEMRSYDRKEASEIVKWLPTLITGIVSALVLIRKI